MIKTAVKILPDSWQPIAEQFIKFCLVGLSNVVLDFSVYWILTRLAGWYFVLANITSFLVAVTWSFLINRKWTFGGRTNFSRRQFIKFFIINVLGIIWQTGILYSLVSSAGWSDLLAKVLAVVLVTFWNFSLSRFWAFC